MIRQLSILTLVTVLVGDVQPGHAQPRSSPPASQAVLDEAGQLDKLVEKLYSEGKSGEAIPIAERALALGEQALGPMHPRVAQRLNDLAALYQAQGAYGKAEPLYVRALDIREKALGPMHPDVAQSLNGLAEVYQAQGAYGKAEPLYVRALDIREKALGPMHPDVASSLNNLALLYKQRGAHPKAEPLYVRALDIRERALGPMHPDVARSLNNLAALYLVQGAYPKAEPLYVRALDIYEKALGPMHPDVAESLNDLAMLYQAQGAYPKAESLYVRALDIREKALGSMHPDVAQSLNNLAVLYRAQGAYSKAEPLYVRALEISEKALGPMHLDVAYSLNNLAALYQVQGAYPKAEPLYVRALDIREKALGPMHPEVAYCLNNLALLYRDQGAYPKAEPLYVRALDIFKKTLGPMHPLVAGGLNSLAALYLVQGAYPKAEPLLVRAIDIREKALGAMHPDLARSLINLAVLYRAQGAYAKAEPLLVRALNIDEKALGPMHPDVALSLNNLASLYRDEGAYPKAEPLLVRALDIWQKALGPMHPYVARGLNDLAVLYWDQGAYPKAEPLLLRAADIRESQLRGSLAPLSESRTRALMALVQGETERLVSFHVDASPSSPRALELALTTVLRRKGRVLDSLTEAQRTLRDHLTPPLRTQLDQLAQARTELAAQVYASAERRASTQRASAIATLRTRIDDLEAGLSFASAEFRAQNEPVTLANVQAALPPGAMLVELVRYRRFDVRAQPPQQEERYVAYLVTSHGPPRWVPLGEAAPIDAAVDAVLAALQSPVRTEATRTALQQLDALVVTPMRDQLTEISHLIVAPDGKLNLIPFEALIDAQGHYELERYLVSYLSSGRDLLRLAAHRGPRSPAVIMAGPDYGPLPHPEPGTAAFLPLPDARAEAADLGRYFPTPPVTDTQATKEALAALIGPAILHVATHGFYARDPGTTGVPGSREPSAQPPTTSAPRGPRGMRVEIDGGMSSLSSPAPASDPVEGLDRAGLAMAGANQGADGIVTAREIAGFDWWGTQLVVLSACETGVGAVPSGDGVYGMRRALVLAGAESQVVSLWSVSDASTRALMRDYYGELARGTGRAEALRRAKLHLLHQPRYAHPYYWAAFIPAGDWRPLDKNTLPYQGPRS
jgi:CHAT domain-containing protein/Tfp pilus assembly protein PilF